VGTALFCAFDALGIDDCCGRAGLPCGLLAAFAVESATLARVSSAIINEAALRALGFASPSAAIGKEIRSLDPATARRHRIIGVAPDFPLESVRDPVPPTVFVVDPGLLIRTRWRSFTACGRRPRRSVSIVRYNGIINGRNPSHTRSVRART
jgi:hypothetical protein